MQRIGFCGLGTMGLPMANHLIAAGHQLNVWSHTKAKPQELAEQHSSVTMCATPSEVASTSDVSILIVGDTAMSESVVLGDAGLLAGARPGHLIIDASSVAPSYSRRAANVCAERHVGFVDAPCTGSKPGAEAGTLTFMVGGPAETVESMTPLLETMGSKIYHCGDVGSGMAAKLSQNLMLANISQVLAESLVLAAKAGVHPELMLDILHHSAAGTNYADFKGPFILAGDFEPNFSLKWMTKDVDLMLAQAHELGVELAMTQRLRDLFGTAIDAEGLGEDDFCGAIRMLERHSDVQIGSR